MAAAPHKGGGGKPANSGSNAGVGQPRFAAIPEERELHTGIMGSLPPLSGFDPSAGRSGIGAGKLAPTGGGRAASSSDSTSDVGLHVGGAASESGHGLCGTASESSQPLLMWLPLYRSKHVFTEKLPGSSSRHKHLHPDRQLLHYCRARRLSSSARSASCLCTSALCELVLHRSQILAFKNIFVSFISKPGNVKLAARTQSVCFAGVHSL